MEPTEELVVQSYPVKNTKIILLRFATGIAIRRSLANGTKKYIHLNAKQWSYLLHQLPSAFQSQEKQKKFEVTDLELNLVINVSSWPKPEETGGKKPIFWLNIRNIVTRSDGTWYYGDQGVGLTPREASFLKPVADKVHRDFINYKPVEDDDEEAAQASRNASPPPPPRKYPKRAVANPLDTLIEAVEEEVDDCEGGALQPSVNAPENEDEDERERKFLDETCAKATRLARKASTEIAKKRMIEESNWLLAKRKLVENDGTAFEAKVKPGSGLYDDRMIEYSSTMYTAITGPEELSDWVLPHMIRKMQEQRSKGCEFRIKFTRTRRIDDH